LWALGSYSLSQLAIGPEISYKYFINECACSSVG